MKDLLKLLYKNDKYTPAQLSEMLDEPVEEIREKIARLEANGTILGYQAVIDRDKLGNGDVAAVIEVRITPERGGGFDRLASRISKFEQVRSCYLMSGGYDLLVVVEGQDLREVARFVSEKLSTLDGVLSTATHFQLKVYKENGFVANPEPEVERVPFSP